jgi:ABC-type glycerol-3-phosphate transport system permease component
MKNGVSWTVKFKDALYEERIWFRLFMHWINTYFALIIPYITLGLPLALWIMLSNYSQISLELDDAAIYLLI